MGRLIVKTGVLNRVLAAALLMCVGCQSSPSDKRRTLDLFDRLARDLNAYNDAADEQTRASVRAELRRLSVNHVEALIEGLASDDPDRQVYAAFALGFSGKRVAIEPLASATLSDDPLVRANAAAALGMLGLPDVPADPFKALLGDANENVRVSALFGLRHLLGPEHDLGLRPAIHRRLKDASIKVRNEALILLRYVPDASSVMPIVEGPLRDSTWVIRVQAAVTLGAIGDPARQANPWLIETLLDTQSKVVEGAWAALNRINRKDFDRSYATWKDWFDDELRHYYRCPLHREQTQDVPGQCAVCGALLERFAKDQTLLRAQEVIVYVCPDHPKVRAGSPTNCGQPGCGKALVEAALPSTYVCLDHPDVLTTTPSTCGEPGCGLRLVPKLTPTPKPAPKPEQKAPPKE